MQNNHDYIRQRINDFQIDSTEHSLIKQIDQWERDSIDQIHRQAQQCRRRFMHYSNSFLLEIEKKLNDLARQIQDIHQENAFNELDFQQLKQRLEQLERQLNQLTTNLCIQQQTTSFIDKISLFLPFEETQIRWKQFATTVAGGNGQGNRLNQLNCPQGIVIDDHNQLIYIADFGNHRIVEWKLNRNSARIVVGGHGPGNRLDQLNLPTDVIIDRQNKDLIIADYGNRRVMRWSRHSNLPPQIIIDGIDCSRLAMHEDGSLYVSDYKKNIVRRWKKGETRGKNLERNQLNFPSFLFVDDRRCLYISDHCNHRVIKSMQDNKEGIVVAGGNGSGNRLTQLSYPMGVIVDRSGQVYVADCDNHRVMRWCEGEREGRIVVGGNGRGQEKNQFFCPVGLAFDGEGNLYVADYGNHRIEKFERDFD